MHSDNNIQAMPVIRDLRDFDARSGSVFERLIFNHRLAVVLLCALATVLLGWQATRLTLNAAFEKTIPHHQPYIRNFLDNRAELKGLGNAVRVVVGNIATLAGLSTHAGTRVLRGDGQPIAGLFAVGNDAASIMGGNYPGAGIRLGPPVTCGYVCAQVAAGREDLLAQTAPPAAAAPQGEAAPA